MKKQPAVYIMANKKHGTIYTGVTASLVHRVYQHKNPQKDCFTKRYGCTKLAYYEFLPDMPSAIKREKQLKGGSRQQKINLIESANPTWRDLYEDIIW